MNNTNFLKNKNLSDNTLATYSSILNSLPEKIGKKSVDNFCNRIKGSNATKRLKLVILKTYLNFLGKNDIAKSIILPKKENKKINIPEKDIEKAIEDSKDNHLDHAIIMTLIGTGLRVSELCNLKLSDFLKDQTQTTITGKGKKIRLVFFSDNSIKAINEYLKVRDHASDYLFTTRTGRMYQKFVDRILKSYSPRLHPHILRHYFATKLLNNGANIMSVKDILGHSSVLTTQIYLNLSNNQLKDQHRLINI